MKTPSSELFNLIKSMSTQEKVQFKLYSYRKKDNSNYVKLFDAIDNQKVYNETRIKAKLKDESLVKNLDRVKNYVNEGILNCLKEYYSTESTAAELCNAIQKIEILMGKRLFHAAKKIVAKAERAAIEHHCYYYLGIILSLKREIMISESNLAEMNAYPDKTYPIETGLVEMLKNAIDYNKLYVQVTGATYTQSRAADKKLKGLLESPLMKDKSKALSIPAKINYHDISGRIFYLLDDWKKSFLHYSKIVYLLEQNPSYLKSKAEFYLTVLSRLLVINIRINKEDELVFIYEKVRNFMEALPKKMWSKSIFRIYMGINNNYMARYLQYFNLKEALKLSEEVNIDIVKQFDTQVLIVYNMNLFMIYFYLNDYHKALRCANKVLAQEKAGIREDIIYDMKFLYLMLHFELGNVELLPNLCKSTIRYLQKKRLLSDVEKSIFNFFGKTIFKMGSKKEGMNLFLKFKKELESEKNEKIFKFFDFIAWIESKIENRSFVECAEGREMKTGDL